MRRRDLALAAVVGACVTGVIYLAVCLVFELVVPDVFARAWRPSVLLHDVTVLGVPADEVLYGAAAGFIATAFPAWAFERRFVPRRCAASI